MILRQATPHDLPFLLELERRFCILGLVHIENAATHRRKMVDANCAYFIAEEPHRPIGYVILRGLHETSRSVELQRIVVAEPGRGLGARTLELVVDKVFREFGALRLWLDVFEDNLRARHVYRKTGFIEESAPQEPVVSGERHHSLITMSLHKLTDCPTS
jgi:diamine N-acetyltransferase